MKLARIILFISLLAASGGAYAQFSIKNIETSAINPSIRMDSLKSDSYGEYNNTYFSRDKWLAERRARRRERNYFEFNSTLQLTQTQFDNWAAGGDNTFSARSTVFLRHQYKVSKFTMDNKLDARYGMNRINKETFKNEDEFKYNLLMSWAIRDSWSYAGTVGFRSQFSDGFKSRTDHTRVSTFMAPGYLDVSLGFNYHKDKSPLSITISPISGQFIFVLDSALSAQGKYGVEKNQKIKKNAGPSLKIDFDKSFGKNNVFRFRSNLYAFTNFEKTSQARWENTIEIKATKFISTTLYGLLYYEEPMNPPLPKQIQFKSAIGVGLAYNFKNRK